MTLSRKKIFKLLVAKYQNKDGNIYKDLWFKEEMGIVRFQKEENEEIIF